MNNSADKTFSGNLKIIKRESDELRNNDILPAAERSRTFNSSLKNIRHKFSCLPDTHTDFTISINKKKYFECSPDFLCDFIVNIHHKYIRNTFPEIISIYKTLIGKRKSESFLLKGLQELMHDFEFHMQKEEKLLFPYIKKMCRVINDRTEYETPPFGSVLNLVKVLEKEHDKADSSIVKIRKIFRRPDSEMKDRSIKKKLNEYMNEFIADFHSHILLENKILFPKAVSIEKKLKKNSKTLKHN